MEILRMILDLHWTILTGLIGSIIWMLANYYFRRPALDVAGRGYGGGPTGTSVHRVKIRNEHRRIFGRIFFREAALGVTARIFDPTTNDHPGLRPLWRTKSGNYEGSIDIGPGEIADLRIFARHDGSQTFGVPHGNDDQGNLKFNDKEFGLDIGQIRELELRLADTNGRKYRFKLRVKIRNDRLILDFKPSLRLRVYDARLGLRAIREALRRW